jgi:hypothetical protein
MEIIRWTNTNQYNSSLTASNITTLNGQSTGTFITSPSVVMSLYDWKNQVNSWSQGGNMVQYASNGKSYYYNFGQFANDMYSNVSVPNVGKKFTKSTSAPSGSVNGDEWYNPNNGIVYKYLDGKLDTIFKYNKKFD